jgi:hypothetical protein
LSLGKGRSDGIRQVAVFFQVGHDLPIQRVRNVLLTYDTKLGLRARLLVEVEVKKPQGYRKVAVDLGETQAITAVFDAERR